ncbi:protein-tyrosine phosphatase [Cordyceps fumosorosea ARSEF 2679]|uniref:Protein-tyrosine phosphatase n=1 Tax=Cordyceps fumosorosea (strain ARSEF 2679) TaxID=1081104 RepID=A0A167TMB6_CORFA|nr:protein-tyrosine phosphatase [Cordyceps fumosorosea ARSEF 2679]OAA60746.1 protein-tyrosine phosphatase [Cordyceps fumosorosea ARSEF 2679]
MLLSKAFLALAWAAMPTLAAPQGYVDMDGGAGPSNSGPPGHNDGDGGIKRFEFVREHLPPGVRLARCSAPYYKDDDKDQRITPETIEVFRRHGISNIISANSDAHNDEIKRALADAGIAYTPVPVEDFSGATEEDFQWAWDSFRQHRGRGATLVWCGFGHGRTGMIVSALQMHMDHERGHLGPRWTRDDYRRNHVEDDSQEAALDALWARLNNQPPPELTHEQEADLLAGHFATLSCAAVLGSVMHMKGPRRRALPKDVASLSRRQVTPHPLPPSYDCDRARDILQRLNVPTPCQKIKNIMLGVAFSDSYSSGTYDDIGATLEGPAGQAVLHVKSEPYLGDHIWVTVDMQKSYGKDEIDIGGINNITLNAQGIAAWGTRNDEWKIQGTSSIHHRFPSDTGRLTLFRATDIQLRAECADPTFKAREDKYVGLNAWYGHPGGWNYGLEKVAVAGFPVVPSDWAFSPPCAVIEELSYEFKLDNWYSGGTWDALSFTIGASKKIDLGEQLSYGTTKARTMDLKDAFGSAEVDIRNLTNIRIYDEYGTRGGGDQGRIADPNPSSIQGITFAATCANMNKKMAMKRWQAVDDWYGYVQDSWAWQGNVYPQDWLEVA